MKMYFTSSSEDENGGVALSSVDENEGVLCFIFCG